LKLTYRIYDTYAKTHKAQRSIRRAKEGAREASCSLLHRNVPWTNFHRWCSR